MYSGYYANRNRNKIGIQSSKTSLKIDASFLSCYFLQYANTFLLVIIFDPSSSGSFLNDLARDSQRQIQNILALYCLRQVVSQDASQPTTLQNMYILILALISHFHRYQNYDIKRGIYSEVICFSTDMSDLICNKSCEFNIFIKYQTLVLK